MSLTVTAVPAPPDGEVVGYPVASDGSVDPALAEQGFEGRVGQEMGRNAVTHTALGGAAAENPAGYPCRQCYENQADRLGHPRSQPRRRNHV